MEVEAADEGRLAQILVPAGTEGVAVNTPIAVLAEEGEAVTAAAAAPAPAAKRPPRLRSSRPYPLLPLRRRRQHPPSRSAQVRLRR
jgi:pyruvate/2-oxoglutarate dehydrogenase complex dihydrolipoamide acyltransferase (E2) component